VLEPDSQSGGGGGGATRITDPLGAFVQECSSRIRNPAVVVDKPRITDRLGAVSTGVIEPDS